MLGIQTAMVWLATIAIIVGSFYAIFHTNTEKLLLLLLLRKLDILLVAYGRGTQILF